MTVSRCNILLVDDEEAIRWVLNRGLSKHGYDCDEAGDAEQALMKLSANPSELVVLDVNMPGRPGNEVLPEITERFPETAVIMASAVTDAGIIAQCIKDGAQDYLHKPFTFDEVIRSVTSTLDKRRIAVLASHYRNLEEETGGQPAEARKRFLEDVEGLVRSLEAADQYTAGHSHGVAEIALALGCHLRLSPEENEDLRWAALLHDVGKIAVDPDILNKTGALTSSEYRHIMTHAIVGPSLVKPFVNNSVAEIISHHHDHYDGSGLGQSVAGTDIPVGARIIAAADAFQAMTSERPYRQALSREDALEEMKMCRGSQFDPAIADALLEVMSSKLN